MTHISANRQRFGHRNSFKTASNRPRSQAPDQTDTVASDRATISAQATSAPGSTERSVLRRATAEAAYWSRKVALKVASIAAGLFGVGFGVSPANLTGADKLHELGIDGTGVRVAVIDQGFTQFGAGSEDVLGVYDTRTATFKEGLEKSKSDAVGEIVTGRKGLSFHGNAMACIITGESMGLKGVAPGAEVVGVSVLDEERKLTPEKFLEGLQWVADNHQEKNIKAISASVNYPRPSAEVREKTQALVNRLKSEGVSLVVAAGNRGPKPNTTMFPADLDGVVSVGATTKGWAGSNWDDRIERYSARGGDQNPGPTIMAPGGDIFTKDNHGIVELTRGTSNSAPMIAAGLALLSQAYPEATADQKVDALYQTAQPLTGDVLIEGHGDVRLQAAHGYLAQSAQ